MRARNPVAIRKANNGDIQRICDLLSQAFEPYRCHYTEEGYKATVLNPAAIRKRLDDKRASILVAEQDRKIIGTASVIVAKGRLHIRSMAVSPQCQRKGIGWNLLQEINRLAKQENLKVTSLECFEPLTEAKSLYIKFGFRRTGRTRKYHGIVIFEMIKTT